MRAYIVIYFHVGLSYMTATYKYLGVIVATSSAMLAVAFGLRVLTNILVSLLCEAASSSKTCLLHMGR
jgi:hypothetical protein